jgi:hypothetical protein
MKTRNVLALSAIIALMAASIAMHFIRGKSAARNTYSAWAQSHDHDIGQYVAFLKANEVEREFPLEQLLISAREIAKCPHLQFEYLPK